MCRPEKPAIWCWYVDGTNLFCCVNISWTPFSHAVAVFYGLQNLLWCPLYKNASFNPNLLKNLYSCKFKLKHNQLYEWKSTECICRRLNISLRPSSVCFHSLIFCGRQIVQRLSVLRVIQITNRNVAQLGCLCTIAHRMPVIQRTPLQLAATAPLTSGTTLLSPASQSSIPSSHKFVITRKKGPEYGQSLGMLTLADPSFIGTGH